MDSLPILVLEKIVQYLSNQDLAACCACSISWRETFDQDDWWEPRCDRTIASHLRITECEVEPGFVSPEREDSKLRQISEWRMSFMRETHLWRNWRQRRYVVQEIEVERCVNFLCFLSGTDVLVMINVKAEVWDVRKTPRCLGEVFTLNESYEECHVFELFDDNKFLVLQGLTLHLYQMSSTLDEPWDLIYTFDLATVVDNLSYNLREAHVTESILVLFLKTGSIYSFDVNNKILSSESKIGESSNADIITISGCYFYDILQSESKSMEFGVVIRFDPAAPHFRYSEYEDLDLETGFYIFIYSAKEKNFLNFRKHVSYPNLSFGYFQCILSDNYIATINNGTFEITDFNTGEVLVNIYVDYAFFNYMDGIEGIWEKETPLTDCPPISMIMDNGIDSSFRIALSKSLGIMTYTRKMFLHHVCKYLNTQGNVNVYLLDSWRAWHDANLKCNNGYTCVISKSSSPIQVKKIW